MDFKGKKILITQNSLFRFAGSEIVTLELATFFKQKGAEVMVFTWIYEEPIKTIFEKRNIIVTTNENDKRLIDFDYIWVHHQVLPVKIIEKINKVKNKTKFIFYHMSALEELCIEQPYVYHLEKKLASISLFVSEESKNTNFNLYKDSFNKSLVEIFPNFFTEDFLISKKVKQSISKVLVVSNHPPKELIQSAKKLGEKNIQVDYIGKIKNKQRLINAEILENYDIVITIGKTVQYCLAMNIPVYIYDHFGGCGFLNDENFNLAYKNNFSGRGFSRKKPEKICTEIFDNYNEAVKFQNKKLSSFRKKFSLDNNIEEIFHDLKKKRILPFSISEINYFKAAEKITKDYIIANYLLANHINEILFLNEVINDKNKELAIKNQLIENMNNSKSVRIAKKIRSLKLK